MKISVNSEKCSGCHLCEMVCSIHHLGVVNINRSAIHIQKDDLETGACQPLCVANVITCPVWGKTIKIPQNIDHDLFGSRRYLKHVHLRLSFIGRMKCIIVTCAEANLSV